MAIERTIRYTGKEVTILWKQHLCIHSKKCWLGLPEVFKPGERPWIIPDGADGQRIIDQVRQCPSGALSIAEKANGTVEGSEPTGNMENEKTVVEIMPNGPAIVKGTVEIKHSDGTVELKDKQVALCRCGQSQKKPYCDGTHRTCGFVG